MNKYLETAYAKAPLWMQNAAVTGYGYWWRRRRYGGEFRQHVEAFRARERYTPDEWRTYQIVGLRRMLANAIEHVPYYRSSLRSIHPNDITDFALEDLTRLPLLEKSQVRLAGARLTADNAGPGVRGFSTSGTTGTPITIFQTAASQRRWAAAYEVRCREWAGVNYQMSRAMLGGRLITGRSTMEPPFWRVNLAEQQLYLSAFHISPLTVGSYVQALNRHKPDYLVGYASGHFYLARFILRAGLGVHQPLAVLTSSEPLTPEMRSTIEAAYSCPVFDAYSGVEACCLASECEQHRLHFSPDVGVVELLLEDGGPAALGEPGEIVATGLLNNAQPLIRYRTGDWATLSDERCGCGREMPVIKELLGRQEDTVVGRDGRELVRFHGVFVDLPHVREGQIIQESTTEFVVRLAVETGFDEDERRLILERFEERLGAVTLRYEYVDGIERTERGKFRAVISKVPRAQRPC